jgi:hypothetical protein
LVRRAEKRLFSTKRSWAGAKVTALMSAGTGTAIQSRGSRVTVRVGSGRKATLLSQWFGDALARGGFGFAKAGAALIC